MQSVSPETQVRLHVVDQRDPWEFEEVYGSRHDFARGYLFQAHLNLVDEQLSDKANYLSLLRSAGQLGLIVHDGR